MERRKNKIVNLIKKWCIENNKEYLLKEWDYEKNLKQPSKSRVNGNGCKICGRHKTINVRCSLEIYLLTTEGRGRRYNIALLIALWKYRTLHKTKVLCNKE